jgi:hypothetical protein
VATIVITVVIPPQDTDADDDGIDDETNNCPLVANAGQDDTNGDLIGDECDTDADNDSIADEGDNCVSVANADQADSDEDGIGDACETVAVSSGLGGGVSGGSTDPSPYENRTPTGSSTTTPPEVADVPEMPLGEVLGDACAPLITTYIKLGTKNDEAQVKLLQEFLNDELSLSLVVDGIYGLSSKNAVE